MTETPFVPNQSGAVYGATQGVSRNMQVETSSASGSLASLGGGDLNGTASTTLLFHQAGTDATRWQMPRIFVSPGNWCGIT